MEQEVAKERKMCFRYSLDHTAAWSSPICISVADNQTREGAECRYSMDVARCRSQTKVDSTESREAFTICILC